jgi:hypothetical protein
MPLEPPHGVETVRTPGSVFWFEDEIIVGASNELARPGTIEDAQEGMQILKMMLEGGPRPCLYDAADISYVGFGARSHVHEHLPELFTRVAILVRSNAMRSVAHMLLGFVRVQIPIRLFTSETDARAWLELEES